MSIKDRLIQYVFRGKNELSPEARKIAEDLDKVRSAGKELTAELDKAKDAQGLARTFRSTGEAAERIRTTLERTEKRAADLREELNQSPKSKGLADSLRVAEREAARAARELDKLTAETKRAEEAAQAAGIDTRRLAEEEKRLAAEVERAKEAVTQNTKELRDLEKQQRAASRAAAEHKSRVDAARQSMASGAKQVLGYAAAYVSLRSAMNLVRSGIGLVREGISTMFAAGRDHEDSLAQLNAALTATGNAAGYSSEQLLAMAQELRDNSNFTTEQIVDAQTRLLSYTGVVGKEFPAAMQIIIDQAQRLGISVEQSAETVGQALESPSKAMAALGRQGFTLEKSQQDLLVRLEATGRMAEAQAIIMDLLTESYGGAAAAARLGTATGLWKGLQDQIGDFFSSIADAGAFDHIKGKLQEWSDKLRELKDDGTLDNLAEALSTAFIQGAEKVEEFIKSLAKVDFKTLADDSAAWLRGFGQHIDDATNKIQMMLAPFRTGSNLITTFFAGWVTAFSWAIAKSLGVVATLADQLPDMIGGAKLKAAAERAREAMEGITDGAVEQIKQDMLDLKNIWSSGNDDLVSDSEQTAAEIARAAEKAAQVRIAAAKAEADAIQQENDRIAQAAVDAVATGTAALTGMAQAMELIDSAKAVAQLEGLKEALQDAYRSGTISQEEYNAGLNLTNERIQQLGGSAGATANSIDEVVKSLGDLNDVQEAIKSAKTDVDISKLGAAIRKMYADGKLTADDYKKAMEALEKQKAELRKATEDQGKAERGLAGSIDQVTAALQRQAAAEQEAAAAAAEAQEYRDRQVAGIGAFFDAVFTAARTPLAAMSELALAAYDRIVGLNTAQVSIDTSGIEATRASMERLRESMALTQRELATGWRGPFAKWASEQIQQSQKIQSEYLQQKLALQELLERYESGTSTLAGFQQQAANIRNSLTLLDASDLDQLNSALAAAEQRMKALEDSSRSTLDTLRDELDRLRGDEEAIEKRRMASRRRDLQAQLAEARAAGNSQAASDLSQAIGMLSTIESEQRLAREEEERKNRREAQAAQAPGAAAPTPSTPTAPATIIRLETARGQGVDVSVPQGQQDALLSILEQAGLRSI